VQRAREQLKQMLLRCCEVAVDVRGGVADYHPRESTACNGPAGAPSSARRCMSGACATRP
jgi:hypothetical protein